ncbi:MAG: YlxR family protein [Microbacteriaceae bacterium]|nr:YlxR family protein [Microbacteriaceae bacterium]MBT5616929.1 YlxR family protein [Microbacteriaceae bacterium]MBT5730262.1 YlxR family protein [Microbacteriaceae bacterium]
MGAIRRCLGCHTSDATENLLRCVAKDNRVVVDSEGKQQGRGAWVHRNQECLSLSLTRRAWSRALKQAPTLDCSALDDLSRSTDLAKNRLNG